MNSVGLNSLPGNMHRTGGGYIFIPSDVDRDKYVETCFRTGRVSIIRENSFGLMNNVRVDVDTMQDLFFPEETGQLGSYVVWVVENFKKQPFIVGVLSKDGRYLPSKENQRFFQKKTKNGTVTVSIDGENVSLDLISEGDNSTVNIISRGGDVNLKSDKNVSVETVESVEVASQGNVSVSHKDKDSETKLEIVKGQVSINSEKVIHNQGEEPMIRGNKAVELLENLIELLSNSKVATSIGLQPLNNSFQISELKGQLNELKSEKSFLE